MKWFFAVSEISMDHHDHDFKNLIRAAVKSALTNTNLEPHMMFDGEEGDFTREIRALGVKVIHHRISFYDRIQQAQAKYRPDWTSYMFIASGALLRLEIPLIEQNDEFILYTDCDVMFMKNPSLTDLKPELFAVSPQQDQGSHEDMNSGVMVMNLPRLRRDLPNLVDFFCDNFAQVNGFDQEVYRIYYKGSWTSLDIGFNWKPYWGINNDASIIHFHGPKPPAVRKLLADPHYDTPSTWRDLFLGNAESYRHYLTLWDHFLSSTPASRAGQ